VVFPRVVRITGSLFSTAVLSFVVASCGSRGHGLPASGTFTLAWQSTLAATTPSLAYSGSIAGIPVSGSAVNPALLLKPYLSTGTGQLPRSLPIARWTGTFESTSFSVSVSVAGLNATSLSTTHITYSASGTYGSQPIRATVNVSATTPSSTVRFSGTIGARRVQGTITLEGASGGKGRTKGTFSLSS
jgi:hypothetical protein